MRKTLYVYTSNKLQEAYQLFNFLFTNYEKITDINKYAEKGKIVFEKIQPREFTIRQIGKRKLDEIIDSNEFIIAIDTKHPRNLSPIVEEYGIAYRRNKNTLFINQSKNLLINPSEYKDFLMHVAQLNLWFNSYPQDVSKISDCTLGDGGTLLNASSRERRLLNRTISKTLVQDLVIPFGIGKEAADILPDLLYVTHQQYKYAVLQLAIDLFE